MLVAASSGEIREIRINHFFTIQTEANQCLDVDVDENEMKVITCICAFFKFTGKSRHQPGLIHYSCVCMIMVVIILYISSYKS